MATRFPGFANARGFGSSQEQLACRHLEAQGLELLQRNYNCRLGEIDLVMRDGTGFLVFVEIRYRRKSGFGGALASVDRHKQRRLRNAAACFLQSNPRLAYYPCRFDVVGICPGSAPTVSEFTWIKNAFV